MGNQKLKWTTEEEEALKAGVAKHGAGKWKNILVDSEFTHKLANRSNVDLKDKWRNMGACHGQGSGDDATTPRGRSKAIVIVSPKTQNSSPALAPKGSINGKSLKSAEDSKNAPKYSAMILEAVSSLKDSNGSEVGAILKFIEENPYVWQRKYKVAENFRRVLSSKLRKLVVQGKLEKVQKCYKIKHAAAGSKMALLKQENVKSRPLQRPRLTNSTKTAQDAANTAAQFIAEAENISFMAAEAVRESDTISQMAADADALLILLKEIYQQCKPISFHSHSLGQRFTYSFPQCQGKMKRGIAHPRVSM